MRLTENHSVLLTRTLPYWITVLSVCWPLAFLYMWNSEVAYARYENNVLKIFSLVENENVLGWAGSLLGFMTPTLLASCLCALLLTPRTLPTWRLSWFNKAVAHVRQFKIQDAENGVAIFKKNQFGTGEVNFNLMSFWLIGLPMVLFFVVSIKFWLEYATDNKSSIERVSYLAGYVSVICLAFFLIPVTRHSILLVAMNWSPVQALRIHVWAGHLAVFFAVLHGITLVVVWFKYTEGPIYREFIPPKECFTRKFDYEDHCTHQYYNMTGMVSIVFFLALWISSLNWFRRQNYRLFYILHVVLGSLSLLGIIWHFEFIALYLLPSICYYMASTMPTLIQAVASRFRGGVRIVKVVQLEDSGSCLEVHLSTDETALALLHDNHPSKFVKLCVPKISIVWHPFTVYGNPQEPSTLRFLFRPVGPFTKELQACLTSPERPVTLIDGFYRGGDHCAQALTHDHVTIVAGGIAITPFLSMMNSVLKVLTPSDSGVHALKSMTLVWIIREAGLKSYIQKTYLEDIARLAKEVDGFTFKVKIHYTGVQGKEIESLSDSVHKSDTDSNPTKDGENDDSIDKHNKADTESATSSSIGHSMELGRMMPARFFDVKWNIPYFLAYSFTVWMSFHILFKTYVFEYPITSYAYLSELTWITILSVLFFVGAGISIEAVCLFCGKYWPSPRPDIYALVAVADKTAKDCEGTIGETSEGDESKCDVSSTFVVTNGRPNSADIFDDARVASAPGIFLCGPKALVSMVRTEAATENSPFFLTRYAIYEEVFEM